MPVMEVTILVVERVEDVALMYCHYPDGSASSICAPCGEQQFTSLIVEQRFCFRV